MSNRTALGRLHSMASGSFRDAKLERPVSGAELRRLLVASRPRAAVELLGKLSFNAKLSRGRPRRGLTSAGATCYANCVSFDHLEFDLRTVRKVLNLAPYITG